MRLSLSMKKKLFWRNRKSSLYSFLCCLFWHPPPLPNFHYVIKVVRIRNFWTVNISSSRFFSLFLLLLLLFSISSLFEATKIYCTKVFKFMYLVLEFRLPYSKTELIMIRKKFSGKLVKSLSILYEFLEVEVPN